jgi:hypothetical protein
MGSSRGVWGLRPQLGVPPLHLALSLVTIAIAIAINPEIGKVAHRILEQLSILHLGLSTNERR